ncbi:T9SS type A sorting domain-containing protein [Hymenobacter arizonensis]|uniref:Por secretion system C-terminal sorting domain-containing protein n=1 Tax=Hymenobacter arizonensis TaxID=1227077 RepID=A0A1I5ZM34_HYMAR|nr:T9SS type A sorting domain-containing protein [Hymenobacter arizonensis]SFQ57465.1 Por secretion system C-terminal sorting domain-containing protein [Hymenobacter arizonensis]
MRLHIISTLLWLAAGLSFGRAQAQVVAPNRGGEVSIVDVTATTIELEFGTSGTGQGRVVAMAATPGGMPVPLVAANDQFYTGSAQFGQGSTLGSGHVVYSGTGHSAKVTGLRPGTYYYITNAEYNSDGTSIAYHTRGTSVSVATRNAPMAPLPVELAHFSGSVDERSLATLRWNTATERNSNYFGVERSSDGVTYSEVGPVLAAGFSTQARAYQWPDPKRLVQRTYYRLRQVDRDGTVKYSPVVALEPAPRLARALDVYPNPSAGQPIQLLAQSYEGEEIRLRITDTVGRVLVAQALTPPDARYLTLLPLPAGIAPGSYILTLTSNITLTPIQKRFIVSH